MLMKCGCAYNGLNSKGEKGCVIHSCFEPMPEHPDLSKRLAKCAYGCLKSITQSRDTLAFFRHHPDQEYDLYYCGCYGWE